MSEMGLVPIVPNELITVDRCRYTDLISGSNLVIQPDHVASAAQFYTLLFANAFLQCHEEFDGRARLDRTVHDKVGALRAKVARAAPQLHIFPPNTDDVAT